MSEFKRMACAYCEFIFNKDELVNCDGCLVCLECASRSGYEECSCCGAWDELEGGMCQECSDYWGI